MIGSVVSHYRVVDRLGAGGMGVVYRAEDLRLGRHVAMKFLPESATADPLATERFQREARTTSALNHPNICTLHDVGEHEGRRFIVMELIDGATLDKVLGAGALPVDRVIDISINVADALDAAHSEGILHRDIKPGNIFITKRGQVKVVDFGLAKMMPHRSGLTPVDVTIAEQHDLTSAGMAVGTVAYMSPEHARGEAIDQRSDLFSLGVVMYEMATGVQTFKGQTTAVIFDQILNRVPVPPSAINPDVIPTLEHIIGRLLEKDRERRYQSSRDVQADLQRLKRDLDARRVVTADSSRTSAPATWAPFEETRSASTVAVNLPTYGVEAEPAPVPAAWAHDWEHARPPSHPEVERSASAAAPVPSRAVTATATISREVASAMTSMVPASGSEHAAVPGPHASAPVPIGTTAAAAAQRSDLRGLAGRRQRRSSPTSRTRRTSKRRSRRSGAPRRSVPARRRSQTDDAPTVPASWTSSPPPTPKPRPGLGGRGLVDSRRRRGDAGARRGRRVVDAAGPRGPGQRVDRRNAGCARHPHLRPHPHRRPRPIRSRPSRRQSPPPRRPRRPTHRRWSRSPVRGRRPPPRRPGPPCPAPQHRAPRLRPRPSPRRDVRRRRRCWRRRRPCSRKRRVCCRPAPRPTASPRSPPSARRSAARAPAREGAILAARTHHAAKRYDAAAAAWIDAARDGAGAEEISEGLIQAADGAARQRSADGDVLARRALGEILDRYPASVRALRALQMKMSIEDRMKLKEQDAELNGVAPASLLTLRSVARGGGTAPVAEFALWRLGQEYRDRRLYDLAAATFADLGTRFPETRYDAWFSAAELFEKQLKDAARAREAYAKVPAASPRYEAAQKKLASA